MMREFPLGAVGFDFAATILRGSLCVFLVLNARVVGADEIASVGVGELVDGIVSRSTTLFSGEFDFEFFRRLHVSGASDRVLFERKFSLSVFGEQWALRIPGSDNVLVNRGDFLAHYSSSTTDAGKARHTLRLEGPEQLTVRAGLEEWPQVVRLGSTLHERTVYFMDAARDRVEDRGDSVIDGHKCRVLAWRVTPPDYDDALIDIPHAVVSAKGGYLVVWVCRGIGFSIPRYEYTDFSGTTGLICESSGFKSSGDQAIYFPDRSTLTMFQRDGSSRITEFIITRATSINQDLPPSQFDISFPVGTRVRDSRPGRPLHIYTASPEMTLETAAAMADKDAVVPRSGLTVSHLVWMNLGVLVIIFLIPVIRRLRKSGLNASEAKNS